LVVSALVLTFLSAEANLPCAAAPVRQVQSSPPASARLQESSGRREIKGYTLTPEQYRKAVEYSRARYRLHFLGVAYGALILLLVLHWRLAPEFRNLAESASRRRLVQAGIFAPLLFLTLAVLGLPTRLYAHWLQVKYGQSIQGWGSWLWDWTKGRLLFMVFGTILVCILYGVMRRSARRWWLYFWLAAMPIAAAALFLAPVAIDPLFFKFEPLAARQPQLLAQIERVTERAGLRVPAERMFVMEASAKLTGINAYVTGIGVSKRVVIWDTTLAKMTPPQTLFAFGHELGHYVLHHIRNGFLLFSAGLLVSLYLLERGQRWLLARWGGRWGIRGPADWAAMPVLLLLALLLGFLSEPVENAISRYEEHQADVYAREVIHGVVPDAAQVAAQSFQKMGELGLDDPAPPRFIVFWLYSHPPLDERLRFALAYDPWSKGKAPEFVKP